MKWKSKRPKNGDTRVREGFLFIPKLIDGEWRWWEHASWHQECVAEYDPTYGETTVRWVSKKWN